MSYMPPNDPLSNSASMYVTDDLMWDPTAIKDFNFYADRAGNLTLNFTSPLTQSMMGESFLIQILNSSKNTVLHSIPTEFSTSFDYYVEAAGQYYVRIKSGGDIGSSAPGGTFTVETNFIASDKSNVNEGSAINFIIEAAGAAQGDILYYQLGGTISSADISTGSLIGTAIVGTDGKANASILLQSDQITEGSETLTLTLQNSSRTITLASAEPVFINDTSKPATYSVTPDKANVDEGSSVIYTVATNGVDAGTVLSYSINGINPLDLSSGSLSGTFNVDNEGKGYITVALKEDGALEGLETINFFLFNMTLTVVSTSTPVSVNDTSKPATYSVTPDKANVDEGTSVIYAVATNGVDAGTLLSYTLSGINASDLASGSLSGTVTVDNDGKAYITVALKADAALEGLETISLTVKDYTEISTLAVATPVTINDTSTAPTYLVTPDKANVDEGTSVIYAVATNGVDAGTVLSYTLSGINASDLASGSLSGTVTVDNDGKATIQASLKADITSEGAETIALTLKNSNGTTTLATSTNVTVNDTSRAPAFFSTPPSNVTFTEGSLATDIGKGITVQGDRDALLDFWIILGVNVSISNGYQPGDSLIFEGNTLEQMYSELNNNLYSFKAATYTFSIPGLVDGLKFTSTSDDPTNHGMNPTRTITWSFYTSSNNYQTTSNIDIIAVNDAPTINTTQSVYKAVGVNRLHLENTGITIADPDSLSLSLSLSTSTTAGKLAVSAGNTGVSVNQLNENSVVVSGTVSQINSLLEGAGDASITFDPYLLMNSNSEIQLTVNDGGLSSAPVSLTIEKRLIQDIIDTFDDGGLFGSLILNLMDNTTKINNIFMSSNNSPLTVFGINEFYNQITEMNRIIPTLYYASGPNSAQANHATSNIIGLISHQLDDYIPIA